MKKLLLITGFVLISVCGYAQDSAVVRLGFQQALNLGLKNRFDVRADKYNISLANNKLKESRKIWIPDIHISGNLDYNSQLQPTYVPKGFIGLKEPEILSFGASNTTVFSLELNETLFKPGISADIKMAKTNLALQKEKNNADEISIKNDIAIAYLNVLLKRLQYKIAKDDDQRFKEYSELAEGKYHDGVLVKNDYLRSRLDYRNAQMQEESAQQNYELSIQKLRYQINVPEGTQIALTDSIGNINFGKNNFEGSDAVNNRTEIKQLKLEQKINGLDLKKARQYALPTVSAFANYSQQFLSDNFDYRTSKWWAPFSYFGIQLRIPITSNFMNHNNIQQYKLKTQQKDWEIKQEMATINYQVRKALTDLQNALRNMKSAKSNYELSQTIYENQKQQFKVGVFQYDQLLNTEQSMAKAEQNYIQSVFEYLVAKLGYMKAVGEL